MSFDDRYESLLARRVARADVVIGKAYVIHARNGGVGVAVDAGEGRLGYQLHREKFGQHFLFVEWDWDEGPPHGTAIPLALIAGEPPSRDGDGDGGDDGDDGGQQMLLAWLKAREDEHRAEIDAAWDVLLGRGWRGTTA